MLEYAADRPWPGYSAWSDAMTRSALEVIASGSVHLTGFEVCCINIVHHGVLRAVAMSGTPDQRALVMDSHTPVDLIEAELENAEDWGRFGFVPAERAPTDRQWGAVFEIDQPGEPDGWHIEDLLTAPIRDAKGTMVGLVSVDVPTNRRRPDANTRERLERFAELVEGTVLMAIERDQHQERIRMARAARDVVLAAGRELSIERIFAACSEALISGFDAYGLWLTVFDHDAEMGSVRVDSDVPATITPAMRALAEQLARSAWITHSAPVIRSGSVSDELADGFEWAELDLEEFLADNNMSSFLLVPIGSGRECLGVLTLSRGSDQPAWTLVEIETARDVGMDLGHAVVNARAFEREQAVVRELQELDTYKSSLVATLSHELKTPLSSILGNLELIEDGNLSVDDGRRSVTAIGRGAQRLVRLVDDLMLLAKVGDPGNQLITRPVDLGEIVAEIVDLTAATAKRNGLTVVVRIADEPTSVVGDAGELDRMVSNLISNAIKYTPSGGRVLVDVRRDGPDVVLTCLDNGIGINESDRHRLFREFFRSSDPRAQGQPGTGLGLAITHQIVSRHGGWVEVKSQVGVGSTFEIRLPASGLEQAAGSAAPSTRATLGAPTTATVSPLRPLPMPAEGTG